MVVPTAVMIVEKLSNSDWKTGFGGGNTYSGFHPDHTTSCQMPTAIAIASSFGHSEAHARAYHFGFGGSTISSASRPDSSDSSERSPGVRVSSRVAMAAHLLAQPVRDLAGLRCDLGRVHTARPRDRDRELGRNPSRSAREQHDTVAQTDCLAHVVRHEDDRLVRGAPQTFELVVEQVARHGVERAERLVHQQHIGVL